MLSLANFTLEADFHGTGWLALLLLVLFGAWMLWAHRPQRGSSFLRFLIRWLPIIAFGILELLWWDPNLKLSWRQRKLQPIWVMVDDSQSMATAWQGGPRKVLAGIKHLYQTLASHPIQIVNLEGQTVELDTLRRFGRRYTKMNDPFGNISTPELNPAAIVLVTDGQINTGRPPLEQPWVKKVPLLPYLPSEPQPARELKLERIDLPTSLPIDSTIWLSLFVQVQAPSDSFIIGRIMVGERLVWQKNISLKERHLRLQVPLKFSTPGKQILNVELEAPRTGLRVRKSLTIDVGDLRPRIWFCTGLRSPLIGAVKRALPAKNYRFRLWLVDEAQAPPQFKSVKPDLVVLNIDSMSLSRNWFRKQLETWVDSGVAIVAIAAGGAVRGNLSRKLSLKSAPQTSGLSHAVVPVGSDDSPLWLAYRLESRDFSRELWRRLPPIKLSPSSFQINGEVLLESYPGGSPFPVLVLHKRLPLALVNSADIWHWFLQPPERQGFALFWRKLLQFLLVRSRYRPLETTLVPDPPVQNGDNLVIVKLKDLTGRPLSGAQVNIRISNNGLNWSAPSVLHEAAPGIYEQRLLTSVAGPLQIKLEAYRSSYLWGRDSLATQVQPVDIENLTRGVNLGLLHQLAHISHGKVLNDSTIKEWQPPSRYQRVVKTWTYRGIRRFAWLWVLIVMLVTTWVLRKRMGLL